MMKHFSNRMSQLVNCFSQNWRPAVIVAINRCSGMKKLRKKFLGNFPGLPQTLAGLVAPPRVFRPTLIGTGHAEEGQLGGMAFARKPQNPGVPAPLVHQHKYVKGWEVCESSVDTKVTVAPRTFWVWRKVDALDRRGFRADRNIETLVGRYRAKGRDHVLWSGVEKINLIAATWISHHQSKCRIPRQPTIAISQITLSVPSLHLIRCREGEHLHRAILRHRRICTARTHH